MVAPFYPLLLLLLLLFFYFSNTDAFSSELESTLVQQNGSRIGEVCNHGDCIHIENYVLHQTKFPNLPEWLFFRAAHPAGKLHVGYLSSLFLLKPNPLTLENSDMSSWHIDKSIIATTAHQMLIASSFFTEAVSLTAPHQKVLLIGLGGGQMTSLLSTLPNIETTAVELEPFMVKMAETYFDHKDIPGRMKTIVIDGVKYASEAAAKGLKYNAVYLDACYNDQAHFEQDLIGPVKEFWNPLVVKNLYNITEENGCLSVYLYFRKNRYELEQEILNLYGKFFPSCYLAPISPKQNVLICVKRPNWKWSENRDRFRQNFQAIVRKFNFGFITSQMTEL